MAYRIKSESDIVNMTDVNNIYLETGEFRSWVSSINSVIIPELERLADSNVIKYGDVGTKPLFDKLIEEVNQVVKSLNAYADERISDFKVIQTAEKKEYEEYKAYKASLYDTDPEAYSNESK